MSKFEDIQNTLNMKEWGIIESKSGMSLGSLSDPNEPKADIMTALAWVVKKREKADFTFEQAQELTMAQVNETLGLDEVDDPKAAPENK